MKDITLKGVWKVIAIGKLIVKIVIRCLSLYIKSEKFYTSSIDFVSNGYNFSLFHVKWIPRREVRSLSPTLICTGTKHDQHASRAYLMRSKLWFQTAMVKDEYNMNKLRIDQKPFLHYGNLQPYIFKRKLQAFG